MSREVLEQLVDALEEFGGHYEHCPQYPTFARPELEPPCNCGYEKAIAAGRRELEKPQEHQHALEQALTRLQKRYGELEAKVAAQSAVDPCKDGSCDCCWTHLDAPADEPVALEALKDAFVEGFTSVQTYNDTLLNSAEEAWAKYKPPVISPQPARKWVGLTDEERVACTQSPFTAENYRAIEAKLKEKNT